jgi:hypothetical protein
MNKIKSLKSLIPLKIFIPILAISLLAVVSFAASVTINTTTSQAVQGVIYNVNGGFTAANNGFAVTYSGVSASAQPGTWSNGGTVTTATVTGNWQYSLILTIVTGCPTSTLFTVTVSWNTGSGYSTMGTLTFNSPSSITNGQTMTFVINTAVSTFSAPVGIMITVA